jgi:predicted nuclease with TOPRIM domain
MTDIEKIISELKEIKGAQKEQRDDIKELSKAFGKLAVQNEQIGNLQIQQTALWDRMEKLRDYQAGCPREQIKEMQQQQTLTLNRQWKVILGLASAVIVGFGIVAKIAVV